MVALSADRRHTRYIQTSEHQNTNVHTVNYLNQSTHQPFAILTSVTHHSSGFALMPSHPDPGPSGSTKRGQIHLSNRYIACTALLPTLRISLRYHMAVHDTHLQLELSVPSMCLNFVQSLTAEIPPYRRARTCSTAKIIRANPGGVQIAD
jgi:hypothetical protein